MSQNPPASSGQRYLVGGCLTLLVLAIPIVLALCRPVSPDRPSVTPTATAPTATPLPTPEATVTSMVIVPTVAATATPAPPTVTAMAAEATAVPTATPDVLPVLIDTPAPTVTPVFRPRPPVQIPRSQP